MPLKIYHGSYAEIKNPRIIKGKFTKDFGGGFYCTEIKEQAERWAKRFGTPILNIYKYNANTSLLARNFAEMSEEWLDFIIFCRSGKEHDYEIVSGPMANDQIYNYINDYINGVITREQFWVLAKFKRPTHQINFCTEKALKTIKFISSGSLTAEGRL